MITVYHSDCDSLCVGVCLWVCDSVSDCCSVCGTVIDDVYVHVDGYTDTDINYTSSRIVSRNDDTDTNTYYIRIITSTIIHVYNGIKAHQQ